MAESTAVAVPDDAQLPALAPDEQALIDSAKGNIDRSKLVLPALKLTQSRTKEVESGDAVQGHFINSLTGEDYGDEVEIVVSALFDGRFYSDGKGGNYPAQGDVAPDTWPDEYAGQHFADIPDAEEQWKADVNAGDHPWGKGPPISTTHNFVGYVVGETQLPVRLSLMRTSNPAAAKLQTLIFAARAPWDRTFVLKAGRSANAAGQGYFTVEVAQGGVTQPELRQAAVELAQSYNRAIASGDVELSGDESEAGKPKRTPKSGAGLDVS